MKRIISMVTAGGLLAGALLIPAMLKAEDKPAATGEKGGKEGFADRMREKLGISEEQEAKLKTLKRAHRDAEESAKAEIGASMRKLKDQLEDKAPEKDLSATLDKIKAGHKAMQAEQEKFMDGMAAVLTPTQRAKMLIGMMGRMQGHGGMRGSRGMHGDERGEKAGEHRDGPAHDDDD